MIDIRRPADLYKVGLNELIEQGHAAVTHAVGSDRRNNERKRWPKLTGNIYAARRWRMSASMRPGAG
jgi:hypothetical protein